MNQKYLPTGKIQALTPLGVNRKFSEAVKKEGGRIEDLIKKQGHYKDVFELWYASILAIAIYKLTGDKYLIVKDENPDVHLIKDINTREQAGFSAEILTLYKTGIDIADLEGLARWTWDKKGTADYGEANLLVVSRMSGQFDVRKYALAMSKYKWKFESVWFTAFDGKLGTWKVIQIWPYPETDPVTLEVRNGELPY